jgi:RND superfamily putative drug exporter
VHAVSGAEAIVGGPSAENLDTEVTTSRDERLVIPLVLAVVLLDALLVRSVLVPALTLLIVRRMWWPSRLSRPVELPDGQRPLVDDEEPTLQR